MAASFSAEVSQEVNDLADEFVTFPCDLEEWPEIRKKLKSLLQVQALGPMIQTLNQIYKLVNQDSTSTSEDSAVRATKNVFEALHKFFSMADANEKERFFLKTFPCIVQRALEITFLKLQPGLAFIKRQEPCCVELSRRLVASIVACGFLCLFPGRPLSKHSSLNAINFDQFFLHLGNPAQQAKLRCILQYFDRLTELPTGPPGNIVFRRQVISPNHIPAADDWLGCDVSLCDLKIQTKGLIEDSGAACVHVDFANRKIGGATLCTGRVQEEIKFSCCPELIASMLFMEEMDDNEAIVIQGYETYSCHKGYAKTLEYNGPYIDPAAVGADGNLDTKLCCIDALPAGRIGGSNKQYSSQWVLRELNKSYAGFSSPSTVGPPVGEGSGAPSGDSRQTQNRAGGDNSTSFIFARDEKDPANTSSKHLPGSGLAHFAADHAASIISTAAEQAASLLAHRKAVEPPSSGAAGSGVPVATTATAKMPPKPFRRYPTVSDSESSSSDQLSGSPPQVDQDRSWQFMNRRRSSNLSDSSRRSSCSTRSTATTEFSSEFEEYYESFQKRERNLKDTAIVEEDVALPQTAEPPPAVEEFAQNLIASIFHEGITTASSLVPRVQKFGEVAPTKTVVKPVAVRPQQRPDPDESQSEAGKLDQATGGVTDDQKGRIASYVDRMMDSAMRSSREHVQAHADNQENIQIQVANDFVNQIFLQVMQDPAILTRYRPSSDQGTPRKSPEPPRGNQARRRNTHPLLPEQSQNESFLSVPSKRYGGSKYQRRCTSPGCLGAGLVGNTKAPNVGISAALENGSNLSDDQKTKLMTGVSGVDTREGRIPGKSDTSSPSSVDTSEETTEDRAAVVETTRQFAEDVASTILNKIEELTEEIMSCALSELKTCASGGNVKSAPAQRPNVAECLDDNMMELLEMYVEDMLEGVFQHAEKDLVERLGGRSIGEVRVEIDREDLDPELFEFADDFVDQVMQDALLIFERDFFPDGRRRYSEQRSIEETWIKPLERFRTNSQYFLAEFSPGTQAKPRKSSSHASEHGRCPLFRRASLDDARPVRPSSVGFRDAVLSDFEDELRKSNPNILQLRLLDAEEVKPLYKRRASEPAHLGISSRGENFERLRRFCLTESSSSREIILDWLNSSLYSDDDESRHGHEGRRRSRRRTTSSHLDWFAQDVLLEAFNDAFVQMFGNASSLSGPQSHIPVAPSTGATSQFCHRHNNNNNIPGDVDNYVTDLVESVFRSGILDAQDLLRAGVTAGHPRGHSQGHVNILDQSDLVLEGGEVISFAALVDAATQLANQVIQEAVAIVMTEAESQQKVNRKPPRKPIATGNWGCGAYKGDPQLKAMLQWASASRSGAPMVIYYTFGNESLEKFAEVVRRLQNQQVTVGQMLRCVFAYCNRRAGVKSHDPKDDLFSAILSDDLT